MAVSPILIRNIRTPEGDGNFPFLIFKNHTCHIRNIRTPEGDGNKISDELKKNLDCIRNIRTPEGDGNIVLSCNKLSVN